MLKRFNSVLFFYNRHIVYNCKSLVCNDDDNKTIWAIWRAKRITSGLVWFGHGQLDVNGFRVAKKKFLKKGFWKRMV